MEVWKDIKGFEGIYQVSSLGRVKSLDRHIPAFNGYIETLRFTKGRIITELIDNRGYPYVRLYLEGKKVFKNVHRLVAIAFIDNPENKREVNHKDGNKRNYSIENLEWATAKENVKHAFETGLASGQPKKKVIDLSTGIIYNSPKEGCVVAGYKYEYFRQMLAGSSRNKTSFKYA